MGNNYLSKYVGKWIAVNPVGQQTQYMGKLKSIDGILFPSVGYNYFPEKFEIGIVNREVNFDPNGAVILVQTKNNIKNYCEYQNVHNKENGIEKKVNSKNQPTNSKSN